MAADRVGDLTAPSASFGRGDDHGGLRRADVRFALPTRPARATVLGSLQGWAEALTRSGTMVVAEGAPTDLVVAPSALVARAASLGADHLVLEGPLAARRLTGLGYATQRLLVLPSAANPEIIVPLDPSRVAQQAIRQRLAGASRRRRARGALAVALGGIGVDRALGTAVVTMAAREAALPFALQTAAAFGVPTNASWHALLGRGDDLQRIVFLVSSPGAPCASWAVKLARVPGLDRPFDRDERGLQLIAEAGPRLAAHAPRLLGRGQSVGLSMSVETAAPGVRMVDVLRRGGAHAERLIDAVAQWLVDLARATAGDPASLAGERSRLRATLDPIWAPRVPVGELIDALPSLTPVVQHNDPGTWNIVADGTAFTVVDWESANPAGLPLWDLLYFLADASAQLAREGGPGRWASHAAALFRGDAPLSELAFTWIRRAVAATDIPPDAVGGIATLGWLHHGASHAIRSRSLRDLTGAPAIARPEIVDLAERWLADPELGARWARWR